MSVYDEKPWLSRYDQGQPAEIALEFTDALSMFRPEPGRRHPPLLRRPDHRV
jgi:long-chain acyl-CoA synthetase